jgi:general secretion pathway protein C
LPPSPSAPSTGFGSTLRQTGPETYAIQRQDVENTLANLNQVAMHARVVPSFVNGVSKGFKLFAMRPDSIYTRLGMKNGDILQRVNGFELTSPTQALEAYNHLRSSSRIELEIERDGQVLRKTYAVED